MATATSRFGRSRWRNLSGHVSTAGRIRRRIRLGLAALASEREITLKIDLQLVHLALRLEKITNSRERRRQSGHWQRIDLKAIVGGDPPSESFLR